MQSEAWSALQLDPSDVNPSGHNYDVLGRLKPEVTLAQARAEMAGLVAPFAAMLRADGFHAALG